MRLSGRKAIVTGGGKGIGEAIAVALAAQGCSVIVSGRTEASLRKTADKIQQQGGDALPVVCDVSDPRSVDALFEKAGQVWDRLDILVNNAGQTHSDLLVRLDLETWNRILAINLTGTFLCSQAALRSMLPRKAGRIINIASTAARIGFRYAGAYAAAKHGVLGLTRTMALETASSGITVNAVCPGWVETDIVQTAVDNITAKTNRTPEQVREFLARESPQNRIFRPGEIASVVVWLASDDAQAITGQAIDVSGGQVMS